MSEEIRNIKRRFRNKLIAVEIILALVFVGASFATNYYIKKQTAQQMSRIVSRMVKKGDHREAVYTLGSAKLENFESVGYFDRKGRRIFTLPPSLNDLKVESDGLFEFSLSEDIYFGSSSDTGIVGTLKFTFNTVYSVLFGLLLWLVALVGTLPLIKRYFNLAVDKVQAEGDKKRAKDLLELATMVKHDLRSPLQSILMAVQSGEIKDEKSREMILAGVSRIEKMTKDLSVKKPKKAMASGVQEDLGEKSCSLFTTIQEIVQEKTHTFRKIKNLKIDARFDDGTISNFINIEDSDFKRVLSNLIDNSVESFKEDAEEKFVQVLVYKDHGYVGVRVYDNGPGVPDIVMNRIGEKGNTFGKNGGSGLGIYSSRKKILDSGGGFKINTSSNGTKVEMFLELAPPASWFPESLSFDSDINFVLLDDDESIIDRFLSDTGVLNGSRRSVKTFNKKDKFKNWLRDTKDNISPNTVFLIDYDLKDTEEDGLDIIKVIDKRFKSFLFTNNFDDFFLQRLCDKEGVKILPKTILGWG